MEQWATQDTRQDGTWRLVLSNDFSTLVPLSLFYLKRSGGRGWKKKKKKKRETWYLVQIPNQPIASRKGGVYNQDVKTR
jgi:hypothetical protein